METSQDRKWSQKVFDYAKVLFELEIQSKQESEKIIHVLKNKGYDVETTGEF